MSTTKESVNSQQTATIADREVIITRTFNAPRELVFKAWSNAELLMRWYAPDNCSLHIKKFDFSIGGIFHTCIKVPQYHDCWCAGVYKEIIKPEKIVFTMAVADEDGNRISPADAGMHTDWPAETTVTVIFEAIEATKTRLILKQNVSELLAKETGAYPSWLQMFNNLDEELVALTGA